MVDEYFVSGLLTNLHSGVCVDMICVYASKNNVERGYFGVAWLIFLLNGWGRMLSWVTLMPSGCTLKLLVDLLFQVIWRILILLFERLV